ncbi:MAG TPA: ATPase, T2SS/T4P/T4SS family [Acidimicrobiia bacterium]|nr:ATPase, T2SS/T4P/T4SS family [Acidimicrobiia bacterium]
MGDAVGVVDRLSRLIAVGDTDLTVDAVTMEAGRLLATESPWSQDRVGHVVNNVTGLGPVQPFFDDPDVSDVLVNGPTEIWIDRGQDLERTTASFDSDEHVVATVERVIAPLGLRLDRSSPMVDARLADGSRLHAVLPPASVDFPLVAIRRFTQRVTSLDDLVTAGTASRDDVERLATAVLERRAIVVSGGTGAGKTTLLNLLAAAIPEGERVVTVEDAAELDLPGHVVRLEARPANAEGRGEITIRSLLRSALRLRPDRIVLGEVRGGEALDLITALNTGHRGSLTTVHANSPDEAMLRLETLALSAGNTSERAVTRQLHSAIEVIVQIERVGNRRRIVEIKDRGGG